MNSSFSAAANLDIQSDFRSSKPRRLTIAAIGSRGDVQPYVALGVGLANAGHDVSIATHVPFRDMVTSHGLRYLTITGNPQELLATKHGQALMASAANPWRFIKMLREISRPFADSLQEDAWRVCQNADAVIFSPLALGCVHCAEKLNIPAIGAYLMPVSPTRHFASAMTPFANLGGFLNHWSHVLVERGLWFITKDTTQTWRAHNNLPAIHAKGLFSHLRARGVPVLNGFSDRVIPRPEDWPKEHHVTGYWILRDGDNWQPPSQLESFLRAGPPPVYVGFGSMVVDNPEAMAALVSEALQLSGQRGVLLTGWGGLRHTTHNKNILQIDSAPHDWLFPRMAAVVHHGGAGTTAAGLRAGVPNVVVPFFGDQAYWARRVVSLGVGPAGIPRKQLTAQKLAAALLRIKGDDAMRARAAALGEELRREDGVAQAVELIEKYVNGI